MLIFCVLLALLKSMIFLWKKILKSTVLKKKFFLKSMILSKKFPVKSMLLNKKFFVISMILNKIFLSGFESNSFRRVRFKIKISTTLQILKNLPKSITCTFHIVFLHITMYSYRREYPRQLDNSIPIRSYNTFCTFSAGTFTFDFAVVSHFFF